MALWEILLTGVGLLLTAASVSFTMALKSFGGAFKHWGDKFDSFQRSVNSRLDHIETTVATRLGSIESKFNSHEERVHTLTLHVERRVTWIEARMDAPPPPRWPTPLQPTPPAEDS